jgi:endonuclease/exonuclease/phosphatase family metal-dependent hydrolase
MRKLPSIMMNSRTVRALFTGALLLTAAVPVAGQTAANGDIVLHARRAAVVTGAWSLVSDTSAAGGVRIANPEAGAAKLETALASPRDYFELPFTAEPGRGYHLWIRSKAQNDSWRNDSVFVQFSGSVTASGAAKFRIGTTSAAMYTLEEGSGAGSSGWGWQDNGYGYGVLGETIYFAGTSQTLRVQAREDGISIDQIVLSPVAYTAKAPGLGKNDTTIIAEPGTTTVAPAPAPAPAPSGTGAWVNAVNASVSGAVLKKTSGCTGCPDAGGVGSQPMSSGSVAFSVAGGYHLVIGLGRDTIAGTGHASDYAFNFSGNGTWDIREAGVYRTEGPFAATDVFTVAVEGTAVRYYRNGSLVYTSKTPVSAPLVVDASLFSVGASAQIVAVTAAATTTAPAPAPAPAPTTTTGATLRVLQWNIHHGGFGTDGVYDTNRIANWIVKMNADVVMLQEVEKYTYWGNQDQPEVYKNLLQQKTGKTWYYVTAQEYGQWSANGKMNVIMSTFPITYVDRYVMMQNYDRSVALASITVNGRPITLLNTHLDPYDKPLRLAQAQEVTRWAAPQPENRILTGDMNAWPDQTSILHLNTLYHDSWTVAASKGTATAFSGNSGETKNGRIDYIFYSKGSSNLVVKSSQVYDTRDANGVMPSDHRPVLTTFEVR